MIYFALGTAYTESGENQKAREAVKSLLKIDPNFSSGTFTQGMPFSDLAIHAQKGIGIERCEDAEVAGSGEDDEFPLSSSGVAGIYANTTFHK